MVEAALIAAALQLAWSLLHPRPQTELSSAGANREARHAALLAMAGASMQGAACSLIVSTALALVPGGQLWLPVLSVSGLLRGLPRTEKDPFQITASEQMATHL